MIYIQVQNKLPYYILSTIIFFKTCNRLNLGQIHNTKTVHNLSRHLYMQNTEGSIAQAKYRVLPTYVSI